MPKFDESDLKILAVIAKDARIPLTELSNLVNLSVSACHKRIKNMEKNKIITGYSTEINYSLLSKSSLIFVNLRLGNHKMETFSNFEKTVKTIPQIIACHAVGGGIDYILKFAVKDIEQYQKIMEDLLNKPLEIIEYHTYVETHPVKISEPLLQHNSK